MSQLPKHFGHTWHSDMLNIWKLQHVWSYMTFWYFQHQKIAAFLQCFDWYANFLRIIDWNLLKVWFLQLEPKMCGVSYNPKSFTQIHEAVVLLEEQILFSEATVSKTFLESSFLLIRGQTSIYPHTATSKLCFLDGRHLVAQTLLLLILCKSYPWKNDCFFCRINLTTNIFLLLVDQRANFLINKQFFSR